MANSVDPDQLVSILLQKPTDLDLHYLQRQDISGFSRTRVNIYIMYEENYIQLTLVISNTDNSNYCFSQTKIWIILV